MAKSADMHMAIISKDFTAVQKMVSSGAEVNSTFRGTTPLGLAVSKNMENIVELLVRLRANVNQRNNYPECILEPPLFCACRKGFLPVVKALLSSPDIDVNQKDFFGKTSLYASVKYRRYEILKLLLKENGIVNCARSYRECPLYFATRFIANNRIAKLLIRSGCFVDFEDPEGHSPLFWCVDREDRETFVLLILSGCILKRVAWLTFSNFCEKWQNDTEFCKWIEKIKEVPRSLKILAAKNVRQHLAIVWNSLKEEVVDQLCIPNVLKDLIMLKEIEISYIC